VQRQITSIIDCDGNGYISFCPKLDMASQGDTLQEARDNLREALELFFETASPSEIRHRMSQTINCHYGRADK
jgi:predicted RNase H-like HicB family nuclease